MDVRIERPGNGVHVQESTSIIQLLVKGVDTYIISKSVESVDKGPFSQ